MGKEKAKNDAGASNGSQGGFILAWVISHIAFWLVMWFPLDTYERARWVFYSAGPTIDISTAVLILFTTLVMALLQGHVAHRAFRQPMRGWVIASFIGGLLSIVAFNVVQTSVLSAMVLALLLPIALVQTAWLYQRVKSAWLWFAANIVSTLFFAFPLPDYNYFTISTGILMPWMIGFGLSQGIIQAIVMRHLWRQPRETEKAKQQPAIGVIDDQGAVQRLSADERAEDIIDEEPLLQKQSQ